MRIAIVSDVHADVHALRDALVQIERLGCDRIVCAGDIVDYGVFPEETIALLRERAVPCIRGNHDRWVVERGRVGALAAGAPDTDPIGAARDARGWLLPSDAVRFLAELPLRWDIVADGVRVAVRHGSPSSDMDGIYPDQATPDDARRWLEQAGADVLIVGHTHLAFAMRTLDGGMIANPGALLRDAANALAGHAMLFDRNTGKFVPAPAPGGGTFGVLDLPSREFTVHRASDGEELDIPRPTLGVQDRRA